ncbi:hypothetical protein HWV62_28386 [Athelia sp. TMB]|nr:hypothetical protein HWV62_28386 [Athelia sp. TMB]
MADLQYTKTSIKIISATPGWHLDVWQYLSIPSTKPAPVIIMYVKFHWEKYESKIGAIFRAHGITANKLMGLAPYAEAFASIGYASMIFDYRRWGLSDGTPRNVVVVKEQLEDYRAVIKYVRQDPTFDAERVILFGTSFSGCSLRSIPGPSEANSAAQCPFTGSTAPLKANFITVKQITCAILCAVKQLMGMPPIYILAAAEPSSRQVALLSSEGAGASLHALGSRPGDFPNKVSASSLLQLASYNPSSTAKQIMTPLLIVAPEADNLCLFPGAQTVASIIPDDQGELVTLSGGHFSVYPGRENFQRSLEAQVEFLRRVVPA